MKAPRFFILHKAATLKRETHVAFIIYWYGGSKYHCYLISIVGTGCCTFGKAHRIHCQHEISVY